jgi:hypothetical protein
MMSLGRRLIGTLVRSACLRAAGPFRLRRILKGDDIRVYYGCGETRQPGYVNIDIRDPGGRSSGKPRVVPAPL